MGYTNETTHYGIPLPLGSDKTTPMDYNTSMQKIDTTLFEAKSDSASALEKANTNEESIGDANDEISALKTRMTTAEGQIATNATGLTNLTNTVNDNEADAQDMITAYNEATATSTHEYSVGDYFIYNDVLYKAILAISVGDTIVPDTNCTTTNVTTEIAELKNLNFQTVVNVSSYTSSAPYTLPSDGYIDVNSGNTVGILSVVLESPGTSANRMTMYAPTHVANQNSNIYVYAKKGMRFYVNNDPTESTHITFRPLG